MALRAGERVGVARLKLRQELLWAIAEMSKARCKRAVESCCALPYPWIALGTKNDQLVLTR